MSQIFPKNLILITKYAYLFHVGKDSLEAFKATLLLLTKENEKKKKEEKMNK